MAVTLSALSCVRRCIPYNHPAEGQGGRLLGCSTAAAFSAAVWQRSQPQTLPVLVPSLHYGCELWGMHSPSGAANSARTALQSLYDRYLRHICGVKYATPSAMLLEELGLSPLQVFWWRRTLEFWNRLAASPVGSLFHTILLDNLDDAFSVGRGARNFSGSIAACLQSIGQSMPVYSGVVPIIEVGTVVEALRLHLDGAHNYALHCPRAAPSVGIVACTYHH